MPKGGHLYVSCWTALHFNISKHLTQESRWRGKPEIALLELQKVAVVRNDVMEMVLDHVCLQFWWRLLFCLDLWISTVGIKLQEPRHLWLF